MNKDRDYFENDFCKLWIKDGVLYSMFYPFLEVSVEIAKIWVRDRMRFTSGAAYPFLADISNLKYITRDAKEYLATKEAGEGTLGAAYYVKTQHEKFLWELFLTINRPTKHSKIFSDKKEALLWLEQFKQ